MADDPVPISGLTLADTLYDDDYLLIEQSGQPRKIRGAQFLRSASVAGLSQLPSGATNEQIISALNQIIAALQGGTGGTPTPTPTPAPSWSVQPAITGTAKVGETLSVSNGTISNGSVTARQWRRGSANISGATGSTYALVSADEGATITCRLTATGAGGTATATTAGVGPVAAADPGIPANALTLNGEPLTLGGEILTIGA